MRRLSITSCQGIQIKTTMVNLIRMVITKKTTNNKYWRECAEKGPLSLMVGMEIDAVTVENSICSSSIKNRTTLRIQQSLFWVSIQRKQN
jgi:hypothetical protein